MGYCSWDSVVRDSAFVVVLAVTALSASCAGREVPAELVVAAPLASSIPIPGQVYRETGLASWYGREFQGRKTTSGEEFDMNGVSAAHRTLPLGTIIRVTNLDNFKSIQLRVNDRGPFVRDRILEVSYGAARELGFVAQGITRVNLETFEVINEPAHYTVQAATFSEEENAWLLKERLSKKYEVISIVPYESNLAKFYRVRVGSYASAERAEQIAGKLTLEGLEPIIVRKD